MSERICDELRIERGIVFDVFENANYFREGEDVVVYATNPLRELKRFKDSEITRTIMKWLGKKRV